MTGSNAARGTTPSQTIGPFFGNALPWLDGPDVVTAGTPGALVVGGRLLDGAGDPVGDGLIEIWQADTDGRFDHPDDPRGAGTHGFRGFGRCPTDEDGHYWFRTVKPGPVPGPDDAPQAPHLAVSVFARGLLHRLVTRIYFPDEPAANAADPVLSAITDERRRASLIATPEGGGLRFDIHLQGEHETGFFAI